MAKVAELLARLSLDKRKFDKGMDEAQGKTTRFGKGGKLAGLAMKAGLAVGAAGVAAVGAAMVQGTLKARDFEKSMANINSILQLSKADAKALSDEVLRFGTDSSFGPQMVADAYYDVVSGVADATKHMAILTAAERTAVAGASDLKATTNTLIGVMNAYSFGASKATDVSDLLTGAVANGVLTMDELASALPNVTALAASTGVQFDELVASLAAITKTGQSASVASTGLKAMMTTLLNPTAKLQELIEDLGYTTGEALLGDNGLVGAYDMLREAAGGSLSGVVTNVEALSAANALATETARETLGAFEDIEAGATERAAAIQEETLSWEMLQAKLDGLLIMIGQELLPVVNQIVTDWLIPFVDFVINQALPALGRFGDWFGVTFGPVLEAFLVLWNRVFGDAGTNLGTFLEVGAYILGELQGYFEHLASFLVNVFEGNWGAVLDSMKGMWEKFGNIIQVIGSKAYAGLLGIIKNAMNGLLKGVDDTINSVVRAVNNNLIKPINDALGQFGINIGLIGESTLASSVTAGFDALIAQLNAHAAGLMQSATSVVGSASSSYALAGRGGQYTGGLYGMGGQPLPVPPIFGGTRERPGFDVTPATPGAVAPIPADTSDLTLSGLGVGGIGGGIGRGGGGGGGGGGLFFDNEYTSENGDVWHVQIAELIVYAGTEQAGRLAARGFEKELKTLMQMAG